MKKYIKNCILPPLANLAGNLVYMSKEAVKVFFIVLAAVIVGVSLSGLLIINIIGAANNFFFIETLPILLLQLILFVQLVGMDWSKYESCGSVEE